MKNDISFDISGAKQPAIDGLERLSVGIFQLHADYNLARTERI